MSRFRKKARLSDELKSKRREYICTYCSRSNFIDSTPTDPMYRLFKCVCRHKTVKHKRVADIKNHSNSIMDRNIIILTLIIILIITVTMA